NLGRPRTAAARPSQGSHVGHSGRSEAAASRRQHVDPVDVPQEQSEEIDLSQLVVQGSIVMTAGGHFLSPRESAEILVQCGAFERHEIEALMQQGYSATTILAERLG